MFKFVDLINIDLSWSSTLDITLSIIFELCQRLTEAK